MNMKEKEILRVNDLKTYFFTNEGIIKAVDGVSFSLKSGETLGIAGESGSGKSVTNLSIIRLIDWPPGKIISGEIFLDDRDILKMSNNEIRKIRGNRISMIFQDPMTSLNPVLSIGRQIMESVLLHQGISRSEAKIKAINLLEDVGIPNPKKRLNQYPHEFSGGMRQRVMIAIALACNPEILIADEPTTALDVTIQAQILDLLNKLKSERNSSIILITHDLGVLAEMADRIIIMYGGKIVEDSDVKSIFYNALHPYTWGLLRSIPKIDEKKEILVPIKGNPVSLLTLPKGCCFHERCEHSKEICYKTVPELRDINTRHKVACHLSLEEIGKIKEKEININAKEAKNIN